MNTTSIIVLPVILLLLFLVCATARADQEDLLLAESNLHLDYKAEKTGWPTVVFDQLKREFNVSDERIYALREKDLTYSEIATVLSMAEQLPGGINDKNVQKIVRMRHGPYTVGWGSVAKALNINVARAVDHTTNISQSAWTSHAQGLPANELPKGDKTSWVSGHIDTTPSLEEGLRPVRPH